MYDYVVTFAKRVDNFCWIDMHEIGAKTMPDTLFGPDAIEWRFKKCENEEGVEDGQDLREFRAFQWLLTPVQIVKMNEWETAALDSAKSRAKAIKDKTIADIEENKKKEASKSSGKRDSAPLAPPMKPPTSKKKAKTPLMSSRPSRLLRTTKTTSFSATMVCSHSSVRKPCEGAHMPRARGLALATRISACS